MYVQAVIDFGPSTFLSKISKLGEVAHTLILGLERQSQGDHYVLEASLIVYSES